MTEYRIEFSIQRRLDDRISVEEDFEEIGFGSSGAWSTTETAAYMASTLIQRGEWETEKSMPTPESVLADQQAARVDESEAGS
jgi:hypothetical protein